MKVTAADLKQLGLIEQIIPEKIPQVQIPCIVLPDLWIRPWQASLKPIRL